ncbi:MAG TPA: acetyl-CoA carboxylase carboxyl transferase subunit beta [Rhodospirillaceae bacterium]|nr:MAG: acetyl-CoA carboxylase subunit beta [Alphaproteobacteria bacterium GWF2_58_20]HAU28553.1 acetyl-CoA carboxylase carboxyl transferase subunit beta [Rhodospirillaceae bacterium]
MNWITNIVRPKIRALVPGRQHDLPDNMWIKCPNCGAMLFHRDLEQNHKVCPHCNHHMRLEVDKRLDLIFDNASWRTIELPKVPSDPLKFRDQKKYTERLKDYRSKTGREDAIVVAYGEISGIEAVVAAFDFNFMGGSMGISVGEGIVAAARLAILQQSPLIIIPASGGARMQEGMLSLMQMPRTTIAVTQVKEAGLPFIVLLTDPTTGGVSASFAMLGDIHIAEPGTQIGFAGARVIQETIRETLPSGFQRAEYLKDHGMVDMVVARKDLPETLGRILSILRQPLEKAKVIRLPLGVAKPALRSIGGRKADSSDNAKDSRKRTIKRARKDDSGDEPI